MVLLLFGLWVLLSGGLSLEICVIGAGVTAALYALSCRVLGYSPAKDLRALKRWAERCCSSCIWCGRC